MDAHPIEREVAHTMWCSGCGRTLVGREILRAFRRGLRLTQGTLTTNELLCVPCHSAMAPLARAEWIPLRDAID